MTQEEEKKQTSQRESTMENRNTDSHMASRGQPEEKNELTLTLQQELQRAGKRVGRDNTTQPGSSGESLLWKLQWRGSPETMDEL